MKNKLKVFIISVFLLGGMSTFAQKHHDSLKTKAPHIKSTGTNKDGTPDMRVKANKDKQVKNTPVITPVKPITTKPVTVTPKTTKVTPPVTPKTNTPDKVKGIVLYGPSGCGKSFLAKVIAAEVKFFSIFYHF